MSALGARAMSCPYCWQSFKEAELLHFCPPACSPDQQWFERLKSEQCPHGRPPVRRRFCSACRKPLLREYLDNDGRNITIIGSPESGKSTYVGVMIHEMGHRVAARFTDMSLDLVGEASQQLYEEKYKGPLYRGEALNATARRFNDDAVEPLIFSVKFPGRGRSVSSTVTVFHDTSGENVLRADAMDPLTRQLDGAAGILLLVDPHQAPRRRGAVPGVDPVDQASVVRRLAELLHEGGDRGGRFRLGGGRGRKLSVPLAVAVTKIDEFRDDFAADSPVLRASAHERAYSEADGRDVHEEVRAWVDEHFGPELDNKISANFATYRYFAVSALGERPVSRDRLSPRGIHPLRVEDPMLWLLSRFGAIRTQGSPR